jgi:GTP-binding protein EngB required for normal cell division
VFALIDSSLPPQAIDLEFIEWLAGNSVPFVLVFTKTDTVAAAVVDTNLAAFKEGIAGWFDELPEIFTCSAVTRHGRKDLLGVIAEAVAAVQTETSGTSPEGANVPGPPVGKAIDKNTHGTGPKSTRPW